jgi:signal transduction histidine kinase
MRIRLGVSDNGAGLPQETAGFKPATFGLAGMRERAALLGGKLSVGSKPGKGVTVTLDLPQELAAVGKNGIAGNGKDSRTFN